MLLFLSVYTCVKKKMGNTKTRLTNKQIKSFFVLTMMATCGLLGIDMHLASMPTMMHLMSTDKTHMQLSISIFLLGIGGSQLFYGPLSDKYGRKPVVVFGLTLAALSNFLVLFSLDINYFLFLRLLQGLGCGVCRCWSYYSSGYGAR